jgi:archaellum biogenesis ATPase FlaH
MSWGNYSQEEAASKLGNGGLDSLPVMPVQVEPLRRLPFWGWRWLDKLPGARCWIHETESGVHGGREFYETRVHLGLIEGRSWNDLSIVSGRECILLPVNREYSMERMDALAAALYDSGHTKVKWIDPRSQEDNWSWPLGMGKDEAVEFAKKHVRTYPQINAASLDAKPLGADVNLPDDAAPSNAAPDPAPVFPSSSRGLDRGAASDSPRDSLGTRLERKRPGNGQGGPVLPPERAAAYLAQARAEVLSGLVYTCIADVRPEAVKWLWPGRIPLGELTMVVGDPGLGKSQICASLASVVTNGGQWPVDRSYAQKGSVLILSAEDNIKHTIRPRLDAANADVSKCHTLLAVRRISEAGTSFEGGFSLAEDLAKLSALMDEIGDVRLVVIDPVSAYLGETDSHKNAEVRGMLAPLTTLAGNHDAAIILVSHLTKSQSANALMRVQGSIAFAALCRAVWGVTADKENRQRRLFMPLKNNLGQDKTGLAYSIESAILDIPDEAGEPIPTSRVSWESQLVETSVEEAFGAALSHEERSEVDDAKEFLRDALAQGRVKSAEVQSAATRAGHKTTTIGRAKRALGILSIPEGFAKGRVWYWELKAASQPEEPAPRWDDPR